jgi:hypothetical protein
MAPNDDPGYIVCRTRPGYGARCLHCGEWLTGWYSTREDATEIARSILDHGEHRCGERID